MGLWGEKGHCLTYAENVMKRNRYQPTISLIRRRKAIKNENNKICFKILYFSNILLAMIFREGAMTKTCDALQCYHSNEMCKHLPYQCFHFEDTAMFQNIKIKK